MQNQRPVTRHFHRLRWSPPAHVTPRKHGVYLLHGVGEHAARYEPLARQLALAGYRVGAHDHPGHGRSAGKRGVMEQPGQIVTQAAIQYQCFANETGARPVLFGHSLGGVAATELVLEHALPVAGLILSAPAFSPFVSRRDRLLVSLLKHLAPAWVVNRPYSASRLTRNAAKQAEAENDTLNHGCKSAGLVSWLLSSGTRQLAAASSLQTDCLLLIPAADSIVDPASMRAFANSAGARVTTIEYENCRHEILHELPEYADKFRSDIVQWMVQRFSDIAD